MREGWQPSLRVFIAFGSKVVFKCPKGLSHRPAVLELARLAVALDQPLAALDQPSAYPFWVSFSLCFLNRLLGIFL